jgi:UDP-glucose 4-epimerase
MDESSLDLAQKHYPQVAIRGELAGQASFFNCAKAERLLGWKHQE